MQNERQAVVLLLITTVRRTLEQNHKDVTWNRNVATTCRSVASHQREWDSPQERQLSGIPVEMGHNHNHTTTI